MASLFAASARAASRSAVSVAILPSVSLALSLASFSAASSLALSSLACFSAAEAAFSAAVSHLSTPFGQEVGDRAQVDLSALDLAGHGVRLGELVAVAQGRFEGERRIL